MKTFDLKGWRTPHSYSNDFAPLPNSACVYVFLRPHSVKSKNTPSGYAIVHELLYVGMSTNLAQRMAAHDLKRSFDRQRDYVQVWFKRCPKDQLRTRERRLIQKLNPPYNLQHRVRGCV